MCISNEISGRLGRWCGGTLTVVLLSLAAPSWAQPGRLSEEDTHAAAVTVVAPVQPYRQFDRVEITGSSIVRKEQTQALPVLSMTADELRRAGIKTVTDAVQSLPMMSNFYEASQIESVGGGYANAVLHGISNGTLVLVNGRRLAPFGRQAIAGPERSGYDLNTLLLSDVERIEVLSDGASSLYGTDAIAGVVNIIMRNERKGLEISVDHLRPYGNAGKGVLTSLGWGQGNLSRDGYSLLLSAELSQRDALNGADRPVYAQGQYQFSHLGQRYAVDGSWVTERTAPGTLYMPASGTRVNGLYQNGVCAGDSVPFLGQSACRYNQYAKSDIYPEQNSKRLRARAEFAVLGDASAFAELIFGQHSDLAASTRWTPLTQAVSNDQAAMDYRLAQANGLDPAQTLIRWRPDLPLLMTLRTQQNWSFALGLKGLWGDWDYRLQAYRSQAQAAKLFETVSYAGLGNLSNDWLLAPLNAANPLTATFQGLRGQYVDIDKGVTQLDAIEWRASRTLLEMDGKDLALGVGMDARRESTNYKVGDKADPSLVQPGFQASRSVWAGYTELQIPVTHTWDINTSLRHDRYSDVGETTNAKVSTRWAVTPQWALRGAVGSGFRAPTVGQVQAVGEGFPFALTAFANPCSPELVALAQALKTAQGAAGACEPSNMVAYGNGNPDLRPEKSFQTSLGLAFVPNPNTRLSVDYWRVDVTDTIRYASDTAAVQSPINPRYFRLDASGQLALYLPMVNLGEVRKSGLDLEVQWRQPTDWGRLQLLAQGTYVLQSQQRILSGQPYSSDLGQYNIDTDSVVPRLRGRLMVGLTRSDWDSHLIFNYTSGYVDADVAAVNLDTLKNEVVSGRKASSFTTLDWMWRYHLSPNVSARFGVTNLLNARAPLSFTQTAIQVYGFNTIYSQLWGRALQLGVTARF